MTLQYYFPNNIHGSDINKCNKRALNDYLKYLMLFIISTASKIFLFNCNTKIFNGPSEIRFVVTMICSHNC